jgi:hypothetical protein
MKLKLIATALIATPFAVAAIAQEGSPAPAAEDKELAVLPEFKAIDANEDGMIEATETESLAKMLREEHQVVFQFQTVDRNSDGLINAQEYVAYDGVLKERLGIA